MRLSALPVNRSRVSASNVVKRVPSDRRRSAGETAFSASAIVMPARRNRSSEVTSRRLSCEAAVPVPMPSASSRQATPASVRK